VTAALPAGYRVLERPGVWAFAWDGVIGWLEKTIARGGTLASWAVGADSVALDGGRGGTRSSAAPLAGPDARARWVCRRYRRGGWMASIMRGDLYLAGGVSRPLLELRAAATARERGIRTPAVVAGAVYRAGPFYRADLITEQVPDARSLAACLLDARHDRDRTGPLRRAGEAVRSLERARIEHRDLNAGNVLLSPDGLTWIVDLDRCRALSPDGREPAGQMRRRLERSLRRLGAHGGEPLAPEDWQALRAGYDEAG
jgi:3-deoxy-D-manno-octulosonic acid kinase